MNFEGKIIWITGASSGIGKAVAIELAKQNTRLILSGRNEASLQETASYCKKNGSTAVIVPFDLASEQSILAAVSTVLSKGMIPDCLYQFGGISQRSLASETPVEIDRRIMEINFFGTIILAKAILPAIIKNGGGHIAVTSSIVGKFGFPYRSGYSASKHALHGFFESMRAENQSKNIRVSIIVPGRIRTSVSVNALDKTGNPHGKLDKGQAKGLSPDQCAEVICKNLNKEKKEIMVGGKELIMVYIRRFFPKLYYFLSVRVKPL